MTVPKHNDFDETAADRAIAIRLENAKRDIEKFIGNGEVTVGKISRALPQHVDILWHALKMLKLDLKIDFDEHSPPPTIVRIGSMRRVHEPQYKSTATHREKNREPFSPLETTL